MAKQSFGNTWFLISWSLYFIFTVVDDEVDTVVDEIVDSFECCVGDVSMLLIFVLKD
jgi:hypothetical protein